MTPLTPVRPSSIQQDLDTTASFRLIEDGIRIKSQANYRNFVQSGSPSFPTDILIKQQRSMMLLSGHGSFVCRPRCLQFRFFLYRSGCRQASGILYVPGQPLITKPDDAACLAITKLLQHENRKLTFYKALERPEDTSSATLALSIISDYAVLQKKAVNILSDLPPLPRTALDLEALEHAESSETNLEDDDYELPPHLQPIPMDDGIKFGIPRHDLVDSTPMPDCDTLDYKNTELHYLDEDEESESYSDEVGNTWIKADGEECRKGARPRFYKVLEDARNDSITAISNYYDTAIPGHYDASPLTSSSSLSPILLIYQIPEPPLDPSDHTSSQIVPKTDQEFLQMFRSYAYLMSSESYRRISAFTQDDSSYPRWLVVQEFIDTVRFNDSVAQKKKEAEWWWRKNGWDGVLLEFFGVKDNQDVRWPHSPGTMKPGQGH